MSCGGTGSCSKGAKGAANAPPSHRTVQVAVERSPTRGTCYGGPNLEAFGSGFGEYASYARPSYGGRQSTPGPGGIPAPHETFGSQIADYNLGWMPRPDVNIGNLLDQSGGGSGRRRFERSQNPQPAPSRESQEPVKSQSMLQDEWQDNAAAVSQISPDKPITQSLMQWFDSSVEKELKKRKDNLSLGTSGNGQPVKGADLNISKNVMDKLAEASASNVEFTSQMRRDPDTELTDAVDKLAKAQAMCAFAGAVKAAEAAAEKAPPGRAEEAALTSAREFQTEVTTTNRIQETLGGGSRPIEVVGYVGVTKPKQPIKRKNF